MFAKDWKTINPEIIFFLLITVSDIFKILNNCITAGNLTVSTEIIRNT